jgi:hypothetical protein
MRQVRNFRIVFALFTATVGALHQAVKAQDEEIVFSHNRGFYESSFELTLSTTVPGIKIQYTKDGTDPLSSAVAVQGMSPLTIHVDPADTNGRDLAPGFCVRAVAVRADTAVTEIQTQSYLFVKRVVELSPDGKRPGPRWLPQTTSGSSQFVNYGMDPNVINDLKYKNKIVGALSAVPTFSMVMDLQDLFDAETGIYVHADKQGRDWERPCSVELLNPDGNGGFQINAGVRIRGGYSRSVENPKHAFRWFFRKEYGEAKLRYPLFGDEGVDEFDNMDLRTSMNYSWSFEGSDLNTMNRDVFSRDTQRDMGQPYTRSRYYHLYINGTYWGLYQTQERSEASFGSSYFGGNPEDYDVVKVATDKGYVIEATDGTLDAWRRLWEAAKRGFRTDEAYYQIQGKNPDDSPNPGYEVLLDVDNLIDYMLCTFVAGDYDGPVSNFLSNQSPNNFYAVYNRHGREGFQFFKHDAEHTMRDHPWGVDRTGPFPAGSTFEKSNPQWIHQKLVENPQYRARFADHVYKHFFNGGALTPEANTKRFLSRKEEIDPAIIAESARWGDSKREPAYTRDNAWLPAVNWIVNEFFPARTGIVLNQLKAKGWYFNLNPATFNITNGRVSKGFRLAMSAPEGEIYYTTDGLDPFQPDLKSDSSAILIPENADLRLLIPGSSISSLWMRNVGFDDSAWRSGSGGIGYERDTGYESYINLDVGAEMTGDRTACYVRIPFKVDGPVLSEFSSLLLNARYDDGFIAYLNGFKVAEALAPSPASWNAVATGNHEADGWESFTIPNLDRLNEGDNLLAIQCFNVSTTSSDFLISVELTAIQTTNTGTASQSAFLYSDPVTINTTTQVKTRVMNRKEWSAANEVKLWVLEGLENLKITEIHYHPLIDGEADQNDGDYEFVELKNTGSERLDLSGLYFSRGIDFTFPRGTEMDPGDFIVLTSNTESFEKRFGFSPFGEYMGQLDNSGEILSLNTADHDTLLKISYDDRYPWPLAADGEGYSLVPREEDPVQNQDDPGEWRASSVLNGTPGSDDPHISGVFPARTMPGGYRLFQNYPNPFNGTTSFRFTVPGTIHVTLNIFNVLGQRVQTIAKGKYPAGEHVIRWDASALPGGIYLCRMETRLFFETRKLLLLR